MFSPSKDSLGPFGSKKKRSMVSNHKRPWEVVLSILEVALAKGHHEKEGR